MDNVRFFGLNLGKLPNCVQYFGSNNVEGVAESWVEAEMSWVEVGAWFSNAQHNISDLNILSMLTYTNCYWKYDFLNFDILDKTLEYISQPP